MLKKNTIQILMLASFILFSITFQGSQAKIDQTNQGTSNSILWSYNEHKERTRTSNISLSGSTSVEKSVSKNPNEFTTNMQLITGTTNVDFFSERYVQFTKRDGVTSPYKQEKGFGLKGTVGNKSTNLDNIFSNAIDAFYRFKWFTQEHFPVVQQDITLLGGQAWLGLSGGGIRNIFNVSEVDAPYFGNIAVYRWFTTNVSVDVIKIHTVPIVDFLQQKYGEILVPELNISYLFDKNETPNDLTDDDVILIERIVPKYQLIKIDTEIYPVTVSQSSLTYASIEGSFNFTGDYSEINQGHEVLISDGDSFVFGWYGLEGTTINYKQSGGFTISGDLAWNFTRDITFDNGTSVSEDIRMPWWKSSFMTFSGTWSHTFVDEGEIYGVGALQTVVEAIKTRASTDTSDQLLMWANVIPSTMFGYEDLDNSGDASVRLNGSVLEVLDQVMAVGMVHGIKLDRTYDFANFVNANSYWQLGSEILNDKSELKDNQGSISIEQIWGVDPSSTEYDDMSVDFNWQVPTENNGKSTFNWDIVYTNFPTTWHVTNGTNEVLNHIEDMDIGYEYTLEVDPVAGRAELSNTYTNSGIQNATIKDMVKDLSMATYKRDLFLGMQKAEDSSDSTEATNEDSLTTSYGSTDIIEHTFGGTKQAYSLGGTNTYNSETTIVNVITGTGTSGDPESVNVSVYSPFASGKLGRDVGLSLLKWSADERTNNPDFDWDFRENIVISAYPTWDGKSILHDPTFASVYKPSTDESSSRNTSTRATDDDSSVSWEILPGIFGLLVITINKRKKK